VAGKPGVELPAKVLIVDDHKLTRENVREVLRDHSIQVCGEAENGKEAIEKVKKLQPDIVLLDINMPVMNGIRAAYEIRRCVYRQSAAATQLIPALKRLIATD
jgi:YesN/AraC family two-component response regulator